LGISCPPFPQRTRKRMGHPIRRQKRRIGQAPPSCKIGRKGWASPQVVRRNIRFRIDFGTAREILHPAYAWFRMTAFFLGWIVCWRVVPPLAFWATAGPPDRTSESSQARDSASGSSSQHWRKLMAKDIIRTPNAPSPPPTYSQAVRAAGLVFVSGTGRTTQ
jgi:hypothetical protein